MKDYNNSHRKVHTWDSSLLSVWFWLVCLPVGRSLINPKNRLAKIFRITMTVSTVRSNRASNNTFWYGWQKTSYKSHVHALRPQTYLFESPDFLGIRHCTLQGSMITPAANCFPVACMEMKKSWKQCVVWKKKSRWKGFVWTSPVEQMKECIKYCSLTRWEETSAICRADNRQ